MLYLLGLRGWLMVGGQCFILRLVSRPVCYSAVMNNASQAFIDTYGAALPVDDARLTSFQREVKQALGGLISGTPGMEMHTIPEPHNTSSLLVWLVMFRPAAADDEFDIMLDVGPSDYILQFDGYELDSDSEYGRAVRTEDKAAQYLYDKVVAALSGRIKLKEISTTKGPHKWVLYEQKPDGEWDMTGSISDWPVRPFAKKYEKEKIIQVI